MHKTRLRLRPIAAAGIFALLASGASHAHAQTVCDQQSFQSRPIYLGTSGSNINSVGGGFCCGGTLGALVRDHSRRGATQYVLSNNHVLGRVNRGRPGEQIIQPGLVDQPSLCDQNVGDTIATLSRNIPIRFGGAGNFADAAIAQVVSGDVSDQILNIGPISGKIVPSARAALGLSVQKMGEATCLTAGTISAVNVKGIIEYPAVCNEQPGSATFLHQILVTPGSFAAEGDSGSLLVTSESCPRAVGLVFAGAVNNAGVLVNPIGPILRSLKVQMVAGCGAGSAAAPPESANASAFASNSAASSETAAAPSTAERPADADIDDTIAIQERHHDALMKTQNAVGTGVGLGRQPGTTEIEVYLSKDSPRARAAIPAQLEGRPVRVVVTGKFVAF
jgi:hypothetical protein